MTIVVISMTIPHINSLDHAQIKMSVSKDGVTLYYGMNRFTAKTPILTCPYGVSESGSLTALVPDTGDAFYWLDDLGRTIVRNNHVQLFGTEAPEDDDDLPYYPLVRTDENTGSDTIRMQLNEQVRVFDNNSVKIPEYQQFVSSQFLGYFWLDFSTLTVYRGKVMWSLRPLQIKVQQYCALPEGCIIYDELPEAEEAVKERIKVKVQAKERTNEHLDAVVDFDPDVNELLD